MSSSNRSLPVIPQKKFFARRTDISVTPRSVLLFGVFEQRSEIDEEWLEVFGEDNTYEIFPDEGLHLVNIPRFKESPLSLRNRENLAEFVNDLNADAIYLDITGLPHHVWMPLIRVCVESDVELNCIYVEPKAYTYNPNPKPGEFFDLSEKFHGFSPLPTFAHLIATRAEEAILIPLLGFEGVRFRHLIERIEPSERDIWPVIGVPGFEIEYPFHTFEGNATVLSLTKSWRRVTFVDAACPFSLFFHLARFHQKNVGKHIQIATIGTKPHALGAMMYALKNKNVELLYDHPVRRQGRTTGMSRCHLYRVSDFFFQRP